MTDPTLDAIRQYLKACGNGKTGMTLELTYAQAKQLVEVHDTLLDRLVAVEGIDKLTGESYDLLPEDHRRTNYINACRIARNFEAKLAQAERVVEAAQTFRHAYYHELGRSIEGVMLLQAVDKFNEQADADAERT